MTGKTDIVKGRIKEAAGVLINNQKLREAGKSDQAVGQIKQSAQQVVSKAKDAAKETVDKANDVVERAVEKANNVVERALDKAKKATDIIRE